MKTPAVSTFSGEDADLVERCRRGESDAFGRLVVKYQDRILNTCWRICGNRADAEDLAQETFVKALRSIERFDWRSQFYTWLYRIAVNLAISAGRKGGRAKVYSLDRARNDDGESRPETAADRLASTGPSPGEQAVDREAEAMVVKALDDLDGEHRTVLVLRDLESLGYGEIAEILDIPPGTVKSRLHRARLAMREALSPILGKALLE